MINFGLNGGLNGFLFKCDDGKCPTIIFYHGNAGNAANRTPMVEFMRTLLHVNVFAHKMLKSHLTPAPTQAVTG